MADERRRRAGKLTRENECSAETAYTHDYIHKMLHELRVHQFELEMQNEELQRIQHQVEIQRERYFDLYDQAPAGYLTLNTQGSILESNLTAATMLGVTRSALVKKKLTTFILPQHQDSYSLQLKKIRNTNEPQILELGMVSADNSPFWALIRVTSVDRDEYRITLTDISTHKLAEESVRKTSIYTRSLIEASLDPLVTISTEGKITDVNDALVRVTGIPRERLIGTDFSEYFTDPAKAGAGYRKVFTDGAVRDYPLAIKHISGDITEVLYNASVYKDEQGEVQGIFAAARDVTARNNALRELKRARDELEARVAERTIALEQAHEQMKKVSFELVWAEEKERERIAGELHDRVGQSLLLAKMKLDALVENIPSDALFVQAEEASSLIASSIQDIRSLTFRIRPPILETSGLETALEWLCSSIRNDYALQIDFANNCHPVLLSKEMRYSLFHTVRELLINVAKHAGTDRAQLLINIDGCALVVQVADNGVGFSHPDVHLKHINNGGYGLYNVRQRIEQMGGRVVIESAPGRGTAVTLTVPYDEAV